MKNARPAENVPRNAYNGTDYKASVSHPLPTSGR